MFKKEFQKIEKYLEKGKLKKAKINFQKLLERHPKSLPLRLAFGDFLLKLEDPLRH